MKKLLKLAESGLLPDLVIRTGIRRLNRMRLRKEGQGDCEDILQRKKQLVAKLKESPIAVNTADANEQHYEVPPPFFLKVLGERLKYSCCLYETGQETLTQAEEAMLAMVCQRARIKDGQEILDLGCGWGSLTLWLADHYPQAQITSLSNSSPQRKFIESKCKERGYKNVQVITEDINTFETKAKFDRIVSIEMFEHMRNYEKLFRKVSTWLKFDALLFVHIFCHKNLAYTFETSGDWDWMGRHFFTGGLMPSEDLFSYFNGSLVVEDKWRVSGRHYAQTSEDWLKKLDESKADVIPLFQELYGQDEANKWFQRWRIFFMACAELFGHNGGNEWWVSHYLFSKR